jgi:ribosomal protein S14
MEGGENKDEVFLPFGSEYSLLLKNLNYQDALVKIEIDGENVTNGGLIIEKNTFVELERFIRDNLDKGHKFKFIEKTDQIQNYRGNRIDDGLIRIEYRFSRSFPFLRYCSDPNSFLLNHCGRESFLYGGTVSSSVGYSSSCLRGEGVVNKGFNDAGITVEGSESSQKFQAGHIGDLETEMIVLRLKGTTDGKQVVKQAVTVKTKTTCHTCGTRHPAMTKFCSNCGTSLQII